MYFFSASVTTCGYYGDEKMLHDQLWPMHFDLDLIWISQGWLLESEVSWIVAGFSAT